MATTCYDSAADCSISLKYCTEVCHVTLDLLQKFKFCRQRSRSQCGNVVYSQIIALF